MFTAGVLILVVIGSAWREARLPVLLWLALLAMTWAWIAQHWVASASAWEEAYQRDIGTAQKTGKDCGHKTPNRCVPPASSLHLEAN
jgi:hypothetical protein